ncbi:MAG: thiol oxidoreductase [Bacteroidetes bacterium]|nr:thiol oxidoreductase [Bacteroidota bacterium]
MKYKGAIDTMLKLKTYRNRTLAIVVSFGVLFLLSMCRKPEPFPASGYDERLSGGQNTVFDATSHAFANAYPGLDAGESQLHDLGDSKFDATFVTAPAPVNSGLGPLYNNVSCSGCHHNDGNGVPTAGDAHSSLLMRISMPGIDSHGGPVPVPGYGLQIEDKATLGKLPEAKVDITYSYQTYSFPDGETYELRRPTYSLSSLYAPLPGGYMLSARVPLPVFGLGLLESIPESAILANSDPNDADGDGISGKPNYAWDPVSQTTMLGRFGWKASVPTIINQIAGAASADMGVTTRIQPVETSFGQPQYDGLNDENEMPDSILTALDFYIHTLAVPARRDVTEAQVVQGKKIFTQAKCIRCHVETMTTATDVAFPVISNQRIHPYTDLLLHNMGPDLADNRPDFEATGQEWRTPPLWGVGLYERVSYPAHFLNDGRARTLIEAIMWHGGEAFQAKDYVSHLGKADRDALIAFLKSL